MNKRRGGFSTFLVLIIVLALLAGTGYLGMSALAGRNIAKGTEKLSEQKYAEALEAFQKADKYSIFKKDARIAEGIAESHFGLEEYDAALKDYEKVVEADPGNVKARYRLGLLYIRDKSYKKVEEQIKALHAMNDDDAEVFADDLTERLQTGMVKGFFKGLFDKIAPKLPKIPGLTDDDEMPKDEPGEDSKENTSGDEGEKDTQEI